MQINPISHALMSVEVLALVDPLARIDANADGTVDWNEFSTYVLAGPAQIMPTTSSSTLETLVTN